MLYHKSDYERVNQRKVPPRTWSCVHDYTSLDSSVKAWCVSSEEVVFYCDSEADAMWLCGQLNFMEGGR